MISGLLSVAVEDAGDDSPGGGEMGPLGISVRPVEAWGWRHACGEPEIWRLGAPSVARAQPRSPWSAPAAGPSNTPVPADRPVFALTQRTPATLSYLLFGGRRSVRGSGDAH